MKAMFYEDREEFMTHHDVVFMGGRPRTHKNCKIYTGVQRPGKTRKDRLLKELRARY